LLTAIGSLDVDGNFRIPKFPPEGLARDRRICRADVSKRNEPIFFGIEAEDADKFLREKLHILVKETIGETAVSLLYRDVGYIACRGDKAFSEFRQQEAIEDFRAARIYLSEFPESDDRTRTEIILRMKEATPLLENSGYLSIELEELLAPVINQSIQIKWFEMLARASFDLSVHYAVTGQIHRSLDVAEKAYEQLYQSEAIGLRIIAIRTVTTPLLLLGEFVRAKALLKEIVQLGESLKTISQHSNPLLDSFVLDLIVTAKSFLSLVSWILGYPDQAVRLSTEAINAADALEGRNGPNTVCHVRCFAGAQLAEFLHNYAQVKLHAVKALEIGERHNLTNWEGHANMVKGWALCKLGEDVVLGQTMLEIRIQRSFNNAGGLYHLAHYLMLDADIYLGTGSLDRAEEMLLEAEKQALKAGERYWLSEVYRTMGELCNRQGRLELAEKRFVQAINIALEQSAVSFELRAVMGLARLWRNLDKVRQARCKLKQVLSKFTEGFETPDLADAMALLAQLK